MSGLILIGALLGLAVSPAYGLSPCEDLAGQLPGKLFYPDSTAYNSSIESYFSAQEMDISPGCVVRPASSEDVSSIVTAMAGYHNPSGGLRNGQFAIRSGGHGIAYGVANIQNGVTIDMSTIDEVELSLDRSSVQIGTGARWIQVYNKLDPLNLTVPGGRGASIGVGGFLTGGGINFISQYAGWGCDSVIEYEVVLASGQIVTVNADSHPDLFIALKGGSNNLALVTRFTMKTWPLGEFWGGFPVYPATELQQQLAAFSNFMEPENFDPHAAPTHAFGFMPDGTLYINPILQYTKPEPYPPVLQPFINNDTVLSSTLRIANMSSFAIEEDAHQVPHTRQLYATSTFAHDPAIYSKIWDLFVESHQAVQGTEDLGWYLVFQPTPALNGTNIMGLDPADKRLVIALLVAGWTNAADDAHINDVANQLITGINVLTQAAGVYRSFEYLNYAAPFQNPIDGFGPVSKAKLLAVSAKYDPDGLFQTVVPGGFKLYGSQWQQGSSSNLSAYVTLRDGVLLPSKSPEDYRSLR